MPHQSSVEHVHVRLRIAALLIALWMLKEKSFAIVCVGACAAIQLCYATYTAIRHCASTVLPAAFFSRQRRKQKTTKWTVVKRGGLGMEPGGTASCGLAQTTFLPAWKLLFPRSNTCRCNLTPSLPPPTPHPNTRHASRTRCAWTRAPCEQSTRCDHVEDAREWWGKEGREGGGQRASLNWSWPVAASHFDAFSSRELNLVYRKMQRRKEQVEEAETVGSGEGGRGRAAEAKEPNVSNRNFIVPLVRPTFWCLLGRYIWYIAWRTALK